MNVVHLVLLLDPVGGVVLSISCCICCLNHDNHDHFN